MAGKRQCLRLSMIFVSSLAVWTTVGAMARPVQDVSMSVLHERWMAQYGRVYKDGNEKARRFEIFKANAEYVESVNRAGNRTYKLGLNQFADLTTAEFDSSHLGYRPSHDPASTMPTAFRYAALGDEGVPGSVDWRARGAVTPVKDQASCWAFSAVGAMEGLVEMTSGQLISLSEQELLDCIGGDHDVCHDGNMVDAFQFVVSNGGITTEDNYPYQQAQGSCNTGAPSVAHIGGYQRVPKNDEAALMKAVANQPVSVAVAAHGTDFRLYSGGVFTGSCDTTLSHAVLAVGYGTADDGTKYWLLKNQWGTSWGEGGYMRLQRGADAPEGLCGVAMDPSYPTV